MALYGYPIIGRRGLGNEMMPWARCIVWCLQNNAQMIAPQWRQIHIGPYLRGEVDKRQYHKLFSQDGYVCGLKKLHLLKTAHRINEDAWTEQSKPFAESHSTVVTFEGMGDFFAGCKNYYCDIKAEILRVTHSQFIPKVPQTAVIGVHIRMGDFATPSEDKTRSGTSNTRIGIQWYIEAVQALRGIMGENVPAWIVSDGTMEELKPILELPHTHLRRTSVSITDMLTLSNTSAMVASGSTFSMWGSFLGQIPTIWHPGQLKQSVVCSKDSEMPEIEWESGTAIPQIFHRAVLKYENTKES